MPLMPDNRLHLVLFAILIISLSSSVHSLGISYTEDSITVKTGESGTLAMDIISDEDDIFVLSVQDEKPWMSIPVHVQVMANEPKQVSITFSPYIGTTPSIYRIEVDFLSHLTGKKISKNLTSVVRVNELAIEKMEISGTLRPTGTGELEVFAKNYENSLSDAQLTLKVWPGNLLETNESLSFSSKEFKTVKKTFKLAECQPAGIYSASADLFSDGEHVFTAISNFTIEHAFMPNIRRSTVQSGLKNNVTVTVTNIGNIIGTAEISESILGALFYSGDRPTKIEGGSYKWLIDVEPCTSKTITFQIDYTPIVIAIIIIAIVWYVVFRIRTIKISKRILQKAAIERGVEFTVGIDIKTHAKLKNVEIRDFVPALFDVRDTPGIKPIKRRTHAGTELIWHFATLPTREERIIDYKIIPHFGVNGTVKLPTATVSFSHFGRRIMRTSSQASLGMEIMRHAEDMEESIHEMKSKLKRLFKGGGSAK